MAKPKYQLQLELDFYVCLHRRHVVLYRRIDSFISICTLLGSGSAIVALRFKLGLADTFVTWGAATISLFSILQLVIKFSDQSQKHEALRKKYADLRARSGKMKAVDIDAEMRSLSVEDADAIHGLKRCAYREALEAAGHPPGRRLTAWEWCCAAGS